jgi:acyl-CoA thioester hydrolase
VCISSDSPRALRAARILPQNTNMPTNPPISCDIVVRVRYAESDPMGYLHHSKYFEYFEMGRTELLRLAGFRYRDLEAKGILFAVAKLECRFKAPARYDDELVLTTRIERMTRARIDHAYVLRRDNSVLCEASSTLACIDRNGRLIPIPDDIYVETLI